MAQVHWVKSVGGDWMHFERVPLDKVTTYGVYIIWHTGNPGRVVRIGQGDVRARLIAHRNDSRITAYRSSGKLLVTWAAVSASQVDGVERHLANQWPPLVGDAFPNAYPIAVNSPW